MINFKIVPDDGDSWEVTATSRDVLVFERVTKGRTFNALADDLHMADIFRLAYLASKRQGMYNGTEKEFEQTHEVETVPDSGEVDPTP